MSMRLSQAEKKGYRVESAKASQYKSSASERSFKPFFVLVRDLATGDYHHPHVHYIFEDDEPDLLTGAVLESLEHPGDDGAVVADPSRLHQSERHIVIDMASNAQIICTAKSMSEQWQPSSVTIASAPTFDHASSEMNAMMTIEGQDAGSSLSQSSVQERLRDTNAAATDRVSNLAAHLRSLVSEYDSEMAALQALRMPG